MLSEGDMAKFLLLPGHTSLNWGEPLYAVVSRLLLQQQPETPEWKGTNQAA